MSRIVLDSKGNNLSELLTEKHFNKLGQRVRRHAAQDFIRHTRAKIVDMIKQAEELATQQAPSIIDAAKTRMQQLQESELQRLRALSEVNPNIRKEEIDHLEAETAELQDYLDSTQLKLEAVRLAVTTE